MKLVTPLLAVVLGSALLAQQGMAADRLSRGPRLEALKSYLTLSDHQVETLTAVQRSLMEATRSIHEQIATKQKELREEMAKSEPSASVAGQLMADAKALRSQIDAKRDEFRTQTRAVLNDQSNRRLPFQLWKRRCRCSKLLAKPLLSTCLKLQRDPSPARGRWVGSAAWVVCQGWLCVGSWIGCEPQTEPGTSPAWLLRPLKV
jgi:hypothetical protein